MAAPPTRRSQSPLADVARCVRDAFWVIALGVIAAYARRPRAARLVTLPS